MLKNKKKIAVYTCITGGYDSLLSPKVVESDLDYICFTDDLSIHVTGWQIRPLPKNQVGYAETNRHIKMMPHIYLAEYDISIYLDGNIEIVNELASLVNIALTNYSIALYEHPFRRCIYDEAIERVAIGYEWPWKAFSQTNRYQELGYPKSNGMYECGVIFRRHLEPGLVNLMEQWWSEYKFGIKRDQVSLPFLAWTLDIKINNLGKSDFRFEKKFFSLTSKHNSRNQLVRRARSLLNRIALNLVYRIKV